MASNIFSRYVWLVDTLYKYRALSYEEIDRLWQRSGLNSRCGEPLPKRTFYNHRKAVEDIFGINIECDTHNGNKYYIEKFEELEQKDFRSFLMNSYTTLNHIMEERSLKDRVIFENVPSEHTWLVPIMDAMKQNQVICIYYRFLAGEQIHRYELEPSHLIFINRNWFMIGRNPESGVYRTYELDRIREIIFTGRTFVFRNGFDVSAYIEGSSGTFTMEMKAVRVLIEAYGRYRDYLRSVPMHESQVEIERKQGSSIFEYHMKPTFDFFQYILTQGKQVEVLEPQFIRDELKNYAQSLLDIYG